jgi:hypothetical protein
VFAGDSAADGSVRRVNEQDAHGSCLLRGILNLAIPTGRVLEPGCAALECDLVAF